MLMIIISNIYTADTFAGEIKAFCTYCTVSAERSMAKQLVSGNTGNVHIGNIKTGSVRSYAVISYREGFITFKQVATYPTPQSVKDEYAELRDIRNQIRVISKTELTLFDLVNDDGEQIYSPWALLGDRNAENRLLDFSRDHSSAWDSLMRAYNDMSGFLSLPPVELEMTFPDGGKIILEHDGYDSEFNAIYKINYDKSEDGEGNPIRFGDFVNELESEVDTESSTYNYIEAERLNEFLDAAGRRGIPIEIGSSGGSGGRTECHWEDGGKTLVCRFIPT